MPASETASEPITKEVDRRPGVQAGQAPALHRVFATHPEPLGFAPSLHIRAFLLERARGNVLIYAAPLAPGDLTAFQERGGVSRQYLNHGHEASFLSERLSAPLFVHAADRAAVDARHHVRGTFTRRHALDGDLEVIPTPGHTPGATAYLWDSGRERLLFTGDTIYLRGGDWVAGLLSSSDRGSFLASLELIRGLEFDTLVPWAAGAGGPWYARTDASDTRRRIDALLAGLEGSG
jgi:hypothetical protein